MLAGTPEQAFPGSSLTMAGHVEAWQQQQQPTQGPKIEDEAPRHKKKSAKIGDQVPRRKKKSVGEQSLSPRSATTRTLSRSAPEASGGNKSAITLRLNGHTKPPATTPRPGETPNGFQSRRDANLSSARARDRERARFDRLANLLPISVILRLAAGGAPDGGWVQERALAVAHGALLRNTSLGETRLSRREILELSALYLESLEKGRERWREEREGLLADNRRLREKCGEEMVEDMLEGMEGEMT